MKPWIKVKSWWKYIWLVHSNLVFFQIEVILTWIPSIRSSSDGGAVELDPTERDGFFLAASEDEDFVEFGTFSRLSFKSTIQIKIGKKRIRVKSFSRKNFEIFWKWKFVRFYCLESWLAQKGEKLHLKGDSWRLLIFLIPGETNIWMVMNTFWSNLPIKIIRLVTLKMPQCQNATDA